MPESEAVVLSMKDVAGSTQERLDSEVARLQTCSLRSSVDGKSNGNKAVAGTPAKESDPELSKQLGPLQEILDSET